MSLIHGIPYVTPLLGAIRLGQVVERKGKRLPQKNDFFTITEQYKIAGEWVPHSLQEMHAIKLGGAHKKLCEIPIRVLYTDPNLNASERYEAYDHEIKRLVCAGDGRKAKRLIDGSITELECPGDAFCEFGTKHNCGMFGRAIVKIEGQDDHMSGFIIRYGSYNGVTTLRAKIERLASTFGDKLPHIPLTLTLRSKSSPCSMNSVFYYPDIKLAGDPIKLAIEAQAEKEQYLAAGIDLAAGEKRMAELMQNGKFELDPTETFDDREEFIPVTGGVQLLGDGAEGKSDGATTVTVKAPPRNRHQRAGVALGNLAQMMGEPNSVDALSLLEVTS